MSSALTIRTVMRQEAQRQRQKARAAAIRARQCACDFCQAKRSGKPFSFIEVVSSAIEEATAQPATDAGERRH